MIMLEGQVVDDKTLATVNRLLFYYLCCLNEILIPQRCMEENDKSITPVFWKRIEVIISE